MKKEKKERYLLRLQSTGIPDKNFVFSFDSSKKKKKGLVNFVLIVHLVGTV